MSSENPSPAGRTFRSTLLGVGLLAMALGAAVVARLVSPQHQPASRQSFTPPQSRPIVQIVRQQPGLPDVSDLIDRLCPSVATIVPHGSDVTPGDNPVPAAAYSADGWLVTSAANLPPMPLDAVFGDGRRAVLTEIRTDRVSGLAVLKSDAEAAPLSFSDQAFPRVGQFGLELETPAGQGCSATASMIGSDFLADGGSAVGYVRLRPAPEDWTPGMPLLGSDGSVVGIAATDAPGVLIPSPIASVIVAELIRDNLSASTNFGFRAVDYAAPIGLRLGNLRSGAGVAIVQAKSSSGRAGLRAGDIVTAVDDSPVSSAAELGRLLDAVTGKAILTVQRQSQQLKISVKRDTVDLIQPSG